jgi:hypothetical protein
MCRRQPIVVVGCGNTRPGRPPARRATAGLFTTTRPRPRIRRAQVPLPLLLVLLLLVLR